MITAAEISDVLNRATAGRRLLDHPFYKAWTAGTLTVDDLSFYAGQYWRQVEAFPGYLETLAGRLPEPADQVVRDNLRDEREDDHPGLWLDFAETVGAGREDVMAAPIEPETRACVESFSTGMAGASVPFALGMLYGYESQTPDVAVQKVIGLREKYGIEGEGVRYFELHGELDIEHSASLADAIAEVIEDEAGRDEAEAGARAGANAIYGLLDGVARARSIC